jgi:hypothetical protein
VTRVLCPETMLRACTYRATISSAASCLDGRYVVLLPCHGHHKLIDEAEETLLYGKRALICVEPAALAKHGEGPAALDGEDSSAASDLSAAERRSLILSFYSHAAPLLPRMCRAAGEVGAMEGKGGAGPRTSEVYMCSEVCPSVSALNSSPAAILI